MKSRVLLAAVFLAALVLAIAAWTLEGARWLVTEPARRLRRRHELPAGRLAS
jgi:hypothetical protein